MQALARDLEADPDTLDLTEREGPRIAAICLDRGRYLLGLDRGTQGIGDFRDMLKTLDRMMQSIEAQATQNSTSQHCHELILGAFFVQLMVWVARDKELDGFELDVGRHDRRLCVVLNSVKRIPGKPQAVYALPLHTRAD